MTKYKLQEMPDVHNTGKKRVYPKLVTNRQLGTKEFIERMRAHNHAISESVVKVLIPHGFHGIRRMACAIIGFPLKVL